MLMNNMEIRKSIEKKRMRYYELAAALGVNPCTLSRWLTKELSEDRKKKIMDAIRDYEF